MRRSHLPHSRGGSRRSKSTRKPRHVPLLGCFETLEPRTVLSGTAVVDDGVLLIQGDAEANTIEVAIAGDTVTVTCDGTTFEPFAGLGTEFSTVKVDAKAGDDTVTVTASDVVVQPDQELRLAIDGGDGNDTITAQTQNVQVATEVVPADPTDTTDQTQVTDQADEAAPTEGGTLRLDVRGGRGEDKIDLAIQGLTVDEGARFGIALDAGQDDDVVSVLAQDATVAGHASLQTRLGWGNDQLEETLKSLTVEQTGMLSQAVDGGPGNDTFNLETDTVIIDGLAKAWAQGGLGNDTLNLSTNNVTINGTLRTHVQGGLGDDAMTVAGSGITVNGTVRGKVDGGLGKDTLTDERAADAVTLGPDAVVDVPVRPGPQESLKLNEKLDKAMGRLENKFDQLEGPLQGLRRRLSGLLGR